MSTTEANLPGCSTSIVEADAGAAGPADEMKVRVTQFVRHGHEQPSVARERARASWVSSTQSTGRLAPPR
jgi:hypothetical protein